MGQVFTKRQWLLFKAYQIKFSNRRSETLKREDELVLINKGFSVLFWVTELVILAFSTSNGIFMIYPNVIGETCDEFSDDQELFMVRTSWAVRSTAGMMFALDLTTAILLLISMKKVYSTIQTHYSRWNPNRVFIAL